MPFSPSQQLFCRQTLILIFTFTSYAGLNACRKGFAYAKESMHEEWHMSETMQGALDGTLMFSYAIGLFICGKLGDRINCSVGFGFSLLFTGFINIIFAMSYPHFGISFQDTGGVIYYLLLWILNGFAQAMGWPTAVKIIANWFPNKNAGVIFGVWASCQSIGNLIGAAFTTYTIHEGWDIERSFYFTGAYTVFFALCVIFLIPEKPDANLVQSAHFYESELEKQQQRRNNAGNGHGNQGNKQIALISMNKNKNKSQKTEKSSLMKVSNEERDAFAGDIQQERDYSKPDYSGLGLKYKDVLRLPNVISFAIAFACLKSVNYVLFFWLPLFLDDTLSDDVEADEIAMTFDVGQIIGGLVIGKISDKFGRRSPILFLSMVLCVVPVFCLGVDSIVKHQLFAIVLCVFAGIFIGGPYNLIPSAIAQDLGQSVSLKGNLSAVATVAGFIQGSGSFAAALIQFFIPLMSKQDWSLVFTSMAVLCLIGALAIVKLVVSDTLFVWQRRGDTSFKQKFRDHRYLGNV